jgi:hypothetical protein
MCIYMYIYITSKIYIDSLFFQVYRFLYICIYLLTPLHVYIYACIFWMYTHIYINAHMNILRHTEIYVHVYILKDTCGPRHRHIHIQIHLNTQTYNCIYIGMNTVFIRICYEYFLAVLGVKPRALCLLGMSMLPA